MNELKPRWTVAACSALGAVSAQEDAIGHWTGSDGSVFAVVADGAGGQGCGASAANIVIETADQAWLRKERSEGRAFLTSWLEAAHRAVKQAAVRLRRPIRASAVALLATEREAWWAHLGDCRLYRLQCGNHLVRTRDDSIAEVLLRRGLLREEEIADHPDQACLLKAFGGDDNHSSLNLESTAVQSRDSFLLCSDGFWSRMTQTEIHAVMKAHPATCSQALENLVSRAVRRGGPYADNTSAILLIGSHSDGSNCDG